MPARPVKSERDDELASQVESVLLVAGGPVAFQALSAATGQSVSAVRRCIESMMASPRGGIRLQRHGDTVQFSTVPENREVVQRFLGVARPPSLSRSALEVLTVVAYRQPATRAEIEAIRGVNSDRALQTLIARGLVEERGHRPGPGRPAEYGTTFGFLEYFGLASIEDLPPLPPETRPEEPSHLGLRVLETDEGTQTDSQAPSTDLYI